MYCIKLEKHSFWKQGIKPLVINDALALKACIWYVYEYIVPSDLVCVIVVGFGLFDFAHIILNTDCMTTVYDRIVSVKTTSI